MIEPMTASRSESGWWQMWNGVRTYAVSITVGWAMCACTVLGLLAVAVPGIWFHVGFAGGAVVELGLTAATLRFLHRAGLDGRLDL